MEKIQIISRSIKRKESGSVSFYIRFERENSLAKSAGCVYSDTILAFCLLEAAKCSENDDKFILMGVYFKKGNKTDQMKASLKKFQVQAIVSPDNKEDIKFDSALESKMNDVLMAQGWKRPEKIR